jgi:ketosteroid isomerase-like protein
VAGTEERVAVAFSWAADDGTRTRRAQVLTLRNGRITGIRDYARPTRAIRVAGR